MIVMMKESLLNLQSVPSSLINMIGALSLSLSRPILVRMEGQIFIPVELSLAV